MMVRRPVSLMEDRSGVNGDRASAILQLSALMTFVMEVRDE